MTEETRTPEPDNRPKPAKMAPVTFADGHGDGIEIYPDTPMPEHDLGPIKAYLARNPSRNSANYFALIGEKHLVPRVAAEGNFRELAGINLLSLISHGVVYWPPARQERYVFIYGSPGGTRVQKPGDPAALSWRQDIVMDSFIRPMVMLLKDFRERNFVHHAIRPSNMYALTVAGKISNIVLGDCLTLPPSYLQPVLYEPIERAMAQPSGRGEGTTADDLYSFGVSIAVMLRTIDPQQGMTDDDIIRDKLENGSYSTITGKDRFKGSILELLRGVLHDDAKERWTIEEIMLWLDGQRLSPKQSLKHKKAARPLTYKDRRYLYTPLLAMDIDTDLAETAAIVEGGDLGQWLQHSMDDEELTERVDAAVQTAREKGTGPGFEERLVCNLSVALDPMAPIRYKKAQLMGDGIGDAMAEAAVLKHDLGRFVELFSQGLAYNWLTSSKNASIDSGQLIARFDQCKNFIRHGKVGYGVERCIYVLSPGCPCLSEKLRDYYVRTPEEMLRSFEDLCQRGHAPAMFLDRHAMAFLSVKDSKVIDPFLFDLSSSEDHRKILGNLRCLGAIQKRANLSGFPGVAKVFVEVLPAVYARYHDREVRAKMDSTIRKMSADGDLAKMAALLSNAEVASKDSAAYRGAMVEYAQLSREHAILDVRLKDKNVFGKTTGKEFAAVASSILAAIAIMMTAALFFVNSS